MQTGEYVFGMIGLGTMGRNLLLNMADHGYAVAGHDKDKSKIDLLSAEAGALKVQGFQNLQEFVGSLRRPRAIMMLVPAGKIVDAVIDELLPVLDSGDLIIDGGNSHYTDTDRRVTRLQQAGLHFFGMGISGGEEGARRGPSMMPGGDRDAYNVVRPVFESVAAKVNGEPCVTYVGPGASGHFVKMVHNGIEYAVMQLIAEAYDLMKRGLRYDDIKIQQTFADWNKGRLQSFLIEITAEIFKHKEDGVLLLNEIKDEARAKGTGKWTSQVAMDLQAPLTAIDAAVSMRDLSKYKALRVEASRQYPDGVSAISESAFISQLEDSLYFAMIISYAQGMHLLSRASVDFQYNLSLDKIARIWRGGCIIRSAFLENIYQAYKSHPELPHLLLDSGVGDIVKKLVPSMRAVTSGAIRAGIAAPAFTASMTYFDSFRTERMPSNLIQAQRDFFGAHTYERIGKEGVFHSKWTS